MKTLIIVSHPEIDNSYTQQFLKRGAKLENVTWHELAVNQPIDVEIEQRLLAENDRIIFQFPLYWYSSPASLKNWQDEVLSSHLDLSDKQLGLVISTGLPAEAYQPGGEVGFSLAELTKPFQALAKKFAMNFLPILPIYQFGYQTDQEKMAQLINYQRYLTQEPIESLTAKIEWFKSRLAALNLEAPTLNLLINELSTEQDRLADLQQTLAMIKMEED